MSPPPPPPPRPPAYINRACSEHQPSIGGLLLYVCPLASGHQTPPVRTRRTLGLAFQRLYL